MAAALTPVFPYLLAALAAALVLWRAARLARRRSGEPPLEAGWLPWLGVGRRFGTDALGLLNECRARHGPCFTLLVAGTRMTFLTSPDDYAALFRNQALSFQRITRRFSINSFGVSPETMDSVDDKKIGRFLQESVARCTHALAPQTACMPLTHPRGRALCAAHLLGKGVEPLRDRALQLLQHTLVQQHQAANGAPQQVDLWDVVQRIVFFASADAIFGPSMATESAFENFRTFDRYMPLLFTGFPAGLIPSLRRALAVLGNMLSLNSLKSAPGRISDFIRLRSEYLESLSLRKPSDITLVNLSILWASQSNSIPAAFWALAYAARVPDLVARVRQEVIDAERARNPAFDPATAMPSFDSELLSKLPLVDTVVAEALRLSSASIVLREAEEDTTLELSDGRVVSVRRGDHVCLFPQLAHTDPAVFERPDEFNPARFTSGVWLEPVPGADGRSRKGLLLPFGGGSGMCPGRFFAYGEIRCLVALAFYLFDIQIDAPLPELDQTRSGVGILPPKSGMPATLRPRPLPVPVRA